MLTRDLQRAIMNWTVQHSGHEQHRPYIGLSEIGDCDRVIFDRFLNGGCMNIGEHLRTRISYELEDAIKIRLQKMSLHFREAVEISLYDGLVRGHPDGMIGDNDLIEIKTLAMESHLPAGVHISNRIWYQVQACLHYTHCDWCHIIYLARENGAMRCVGIHYKPSVGEHIEAKVARLVTAVQECQRPACLCGKCEGGTGDGGRMTEGERVRSGGVGVGSGETLEAVRR